MSSGTTTQKELPPFKHKRLFLIPLDNRPVCADLPARLARMVGLELTLPGSKLLGQLKTPAPETKLFKWLKSNLFEGDPVIVGLDTIAYGGLIASRINTDSTETIRARLDRFYGLVHASAMYGFSSILRIPNYNFSEEEPDYWGTHGCDLYRYSETMHRSGSVPDEISKAIPKEVLSNFLERRTRQFNINESLLADLKEDRLDYLTFCQDDTGEFGLNVKEADDLKVKIKKIKNKKDASVNSHVQTGADEVACLMLTRWVLSHVQEHQQTYKVAAIFSSPDGYEHIMKFDGVSTQTVIEQAVSSCGAEFTDSPDTADLVLFVHTPKPLLNQGDHCDGNVLISSRAEVTSMAEHIKDLQQRYPNLAFADVSHANGTDAQLTEALLLNQLDFKALYGYAGWNTPGNTLGTVIATGLLRLAGEAMGTFCSETFKRLMLIRLADDWLYQSNVRSTLRAHLKKQSANYATQPTNDDDTERLNVEMADGLALIKSRLNLDNVSTHCFFPCKRTFEIGIDDGRLIQ